jgi:hypothetical protein
MLRLLKFLETRSVKAVEQTRSLTCVCVLHAEATNARVAWFSVGSLLICVVLAAWQLYYLKQFFTKKKLL